MYEPSRPLWRQTDGRRWSILALALLMTFSLSGLQGCALTIEEAVVVAPDPPPPARPEVRPMKPGVRFAWKPGRWRYLEKKKRYAWSPGSWIRIRQPYHRHWIPGSWQQTSDGYVWTRGHWR